MVSGSAECAPRCWGSRIKSGVRGQDIRMWNVANVVESAGGGLYLPCRWLSLGLNEAAIICEVGKHHGCVFVFFRDPDDAGEKLLGINSCCQ